MGLRIPAAIAALLLAPLAVGAQSTTPSTTRTTTPSAAGAAASSAGAAAGPTVPVDNRPSWVVGLAALATVSVDPQYLYLSYSIPLVLRERLQKVPDHVLGSEERAAQRAEIIAAEIRRLSGLLNAKRGERDAAAGQTGDRAQRDRDRAVEQIETLKAQISALEALRPELIEVAERKPLAFWSPTASGASSLLENPRYSPLQTARSSGVDLLVFGSLEQVQEYLFLDVKAMDYPRGQIVLDYQDAFLPSEIYAGLDGLAGELATLILGEPWGSIVVRATPDDALIRVDGRYVGAGSVRIDFARPGETSVVAAAQGHASLESTVSVTAGESTEVVLDLVEVPSVPIGIRSDPLLADVYLDSRWVGRTPLEVPRPVGLQRVEILREGLQAERFSLSPDTTALPPVDLKRAIWTPTQMQRTARDRFYAALGVFVVSLPLPIVLWAVSLDQATAFLQALNAGDVQDQIDIAVTYRRLYGGYLGGLFVSASLAVNVVINLVSYVIAADRPAG